MYKRAVRILFVGPPDAVLLAQECARELGYGMVEALARIPAPESTDESAHPVLPASAYFCASGLNVQAVSPDDIAWADLYIIVGEVSVLDNSIRPGLAVRRWPAPTVTEHPETYAAALRNRIQGIVGGVRLLGRMDAP